MIARCKITTRWVAISLVSFSTQTVLAASQPTINSLSFSTYPTVMTLSAGPSWQHAGDTQTLYLTPSIEKTYAANHSTNTLADVEFFLGKQIPLSHNIQSQLGFAFATTGNAKLSGNIWDDADPEFNNYNYQYKIDHTYFALKGKLLGDWGSIAEPWISASLGVGLNRANGFYNSPTIFEAVATPNFHSNRKAVFSYTLGAGIQKALTPNWQVGVGYEFSDWGKSQLDRASEQTLGNGLTLNHLYTNSVLINLTYIS